MRELRDYKVVYGCCATGFEDVTLRGTHAACVNYIRRHAWRLANPDKDPHYTDSLEIMDVNTGRLMSWSF